MIKYILTAIIHIAFINQTIKANNLSNQKQTPVVEKQADKDYYCPMHPAIVSDKPGKCPKCGMELEKKTSDSQSTLVSLLDKPTFETTQKETKVQAWLLTDQQRKELVKHFRESTTDSIIKNRMNDSSFMNIVLKGTHHLIVRVTDKAGKEMGETVKVVVNAPSGKKSSNILNAMLDSFEGSLNLDEKGKYKLDLAISNKGKTVESHFTYNNQ